MKLAKFLKRSPDTATVEDLRRFHLEQGKGRYAVLPPVLLERLRVWWRAAHSQGKMLPGGWLFPGPTPRSP
jgi:hypothetical protein